MDQPTGSSWINSAPLAPSIKRSDPWGWMLASAFAGSVVGLAVLGLTWGHLPILGAPPWSLLDQLACSGQALVRILAKGLFAHEAKTCAAAWAGLGGMDRGAVIFRLVLAGVGACFPAWAMLGNFMTPRDRLIFLRGPSRFEGVAATRALRSRFAQDWKTRPDHEIAPGVPYPGDKWATHILMVGGTGAGKSTCIKPLLRKIIDARESILVFDPKGEFTSNFGSPIILAPWDSRSFAWDIGRDMRNVADMRRFAESLVEQSTDPMWANASRQILVGCMAYLQATHGSDWGFPELADVIAAPQLTMADMMKRHHPEAARLVEKPNVTTQGILINLASSCSSIFDLAQAWGEVPDSRRVSFIDWTQGKGPRQIILQGHASYPNLTRSYARPVLEVVASLVGSSEMRDDPTRKRWVICDEFPALGKVNIRLLIEQGRSRGFRCVLACQDFAQLEEIHGEKMVKAMTAMVGTIIVGRMGPGDTAEQLAKAVGVRELERPSVSTSYAGAGGSSNPSTTLSFTRETVPLYLPSELGSRLGLSANKDGVVMALVTEGTAYELHWPFFKMKEVRPQFVPAPWTMGAKPVPAEDDADGGRGLGGGGRAPQKIAADSEEHERRIAQLDGAADALSASEVVVAPADMLPALESELHPADDIALKAIGHATPLPGLSVAAHVAHALDLMSDLRPGPPQEVRAASKSPMKAPTAPPPSRERRLGE